MTKRKTRVDEIIILGPRRPVRDWPTHVQDLVAEGKNLNPTQETLIREEVFRAVISEGKDANLPSFVKMGLATGGYMSIRQPVEYASYDYTEVEETEVPAEEVDPEAVVAEAEEAVEEQAEQAPSRNRRSR